MPLATSENYGNSLLSVQTLQKKNQSLKAEIDRHEPIIMQTIDEGQSMIEEGHPQSELFQEQNNELLDRWDALKQAVDDRKARLELSEISQQVRFFDLSEYLKIGINKCKTCRNNL